MSLAPKWAKAAAVLGLEMQLHQLRLTVDVSIDTYGVTAFDKALIEELERRLKLIEAMKD